MVLSRRLLLAVLGALLLVAPAAATPIEEKLERLQREIDQASRREGVLTSQIQAMDVQIAVLQNKVDAAGAKLAGLERELARWQVRLDRVTAVYRAQTERQQDLQEQLDEAKVVLARRLAAIYQEGTPDAMAVILGAESMDDAISQIEFVQQVGDHDRMVARRVMAMRDRMIEQRNRTRRVRGQLLTASKEVRERTAEAREVHTELLASKNTLSTARSTKRNALSRVRDTKLEFLREQAALRAESARIAAKIRGAQTNSSARPSAGGLIWPCVGTVTSGFGPRWGRMHEGIDIAAPVGTPIYAAASGTVIAAGWFGGYGNFTRTDISPRSSSRWDSS
jgi:murein DD-endopeptidase MepM/ murein hydrolase activator NlpD